MEWSEIKKRENVNPRKNKEEESEHDEKRRKERKAVQIIPVGMGDEDPSIKLPTLLFQEMTRIFAKSCSQLSGHEGIGQKCSTNHLNVRAGFGSS